MQGCKVPTAWQERIHREGGKIGRDFGKGGKGCRHVALCDKLTLVVKGLNHLLGNLAGVVAGLPEPAGAFATRWIRCPCALEIALSNSLHRNAHMPLWKRSQTSSGILLPCTPRAQLPALHRRIIATFAGARANRQDAAALVGQ